MLLKLAVVAFTSLAAFSAVAQGISPPEPTKECKAAQAKVFRERSALDAAITQRAKDSKGRESCATKTSCARYDSAIGTQEKRITRHEARIKKFEITQQRACAR